MKNASGNKNPLISVLMPVYNASQFLKYSIESILKQTLSHFELIIVDDGSTDESQMIIKDYAKKDSRIVLLNHIENMGVVKTRNLLIKHAKGDYIAFHDADDISDPNRLSKQLSYLNEHNLDLVGSFATVISKEEKVLDILFFPKNHDHMLLYLTHSYPFPNGTLFFKRAIIENLFFKNIEVEDYHYIFQIFQKNPIIIGNVPEFLYKYREYSGNISKASPTERIISKYAVGYSFIIKNIEALHIIIQSIIHSKNSINNIEKVSLLRATFYIGLATNKWQYFFSAFKYFKTTKGLYAVFCHAKYYFKYRRKIKSLSNSLLNK